VREERTGLRLVAGDGDRAHRAGSLIRWRFRRDRRDYVLLRDVVPAVDDVERPATVDIVQLDVSFRRCDSIRLERLLPLEMLASSCDVPEAPAFWIDPR
jgi:hypothetical protein